MLTTIQASMLRMSRMTGYSDKDRVLRAIHRFHERTQRHPTSNELASRTINFLNAPGTRKTILELEVDGLARTTPQGRTFVCELTQQGVARLATIADQIGGGTQ